MPYGSAQGVAEHASTWTDDGAFLDADAYQPGTIPSLETVERWIEEVSDLMDLALAGEGFTTPVINSMSDKAAQALRILGAKVNVAVADLVKLQHDKGRLFTDRFRETGEDGSAILEREFVTWVKKRVNNFEAFGIPRIIDQAEGTSYSVPAGRQL